MSIPPGLLSYWPKLDEVKAIGTEAESLPDAVLLAVHRRIDMVRRPLTGTAEGRRVQEDALLDFVLHGLKPEGYLLAPVTGPSGAGKSHLVRWLEIRLHHHPDAARFHVIRVPKSASLRTVVESVLEPVKHLPECSGMLADLQQAASALTEEEAAAMFGTILELALVERVPVWREQGGSVDGIPASMLAFHAPLLAKFVQDPVLASHFRERVYPRLLKRALRGRDEADGDADKPPRFEEDDLSLPSELEDRLDDAARSTQTYYRSRLERPDGRAAAVAALNAVADNVVSRVFKLGQLSGGKSLQDMMREIRRSLHTAGRELVLLVEDFYALTGIQDHLLSFCIQEVVEEDRPMCPIRTVMAMTDSALDGRDTIKTRSEYEWALVTEEQDEERVVDALVELAGRYLNAARIGRQHLIDSYDPAEGTVQIRYTPEADDESGSNLRMAFGETQDGISLFPLSRHSIHFLARKTLLHADRLQFIPRIALQRIVRDVLKARPQFEQGTFPSGLEHIDGQAAVELTSVFAGLTAPLKDRYQRTVVCWGNDPRTITELGERLDPRIFKAFGLKPLDALGKGPKPGPEGPRRPGPSQEPGAKPAPGAEDPAAAVNAKWRPLMDAWARGTRLGLPEAQEIRKLIHAVVLAHIDWNALCLSPGDFDFYSFELPLALGQKRQHKTESPVIKVTGPSGVADCVEPELAREILAMLRFHGVKGLNYGDVDEDSLHVVDFLDRMSRALESAALIAAESKLIPLAHGAVRAGYVLRGVAPDASLAERLAAALAPNQSAPPESGATGWDNLRSECWARSGDLRSALLRYLQVVQGEGTTPHAVDFARFSRAMEAPAADSTAINARLRGDVAEPLAKLLVSLTAPRLSAPVNAARAKLEEWTRHALHEAGLKGTADEPAALRDSAIPLIDAAVLHSLWPTQLAGGGEVPKSGAMQAAIREFAELPWSQMTSHCLALLQAQVLNAETAAAMMATVPWSEMQKVGAVLSGYRDLLGALEKRVAAQEKVVGGSNPARTAGAIKDVSDHLDGIASALEKEAKT